MKFILIAILLFTINVLAGPIYNNVTVEDLLTLQYATPGKFLSVDGSGNVTTAVDPLPSQTGQSGKYLTTNGTLASWGTIVTTGGTVTSVSLVADSAFTVVGSPVTGNGTLDLALASQTANLVLASPNGISGIPTFRALVSNDIPNNAANTSGTSANVTSSSNNTLVTLSSLSLPYSQITGSPSVLTFNPPLSVLSSVVSISQSTGSVDGYLSLTDWNIFNNKAPINSPTFTGIPTAPTASVGTNTTQIATTEFVLSQGFTVASGSMPSASSTTLVTTTSATTTFVTAITASIVVTATSAPVIAECVLDMTSATAASVATVRVTINGVSGGSVTESLTTATTQHLTVPNQNLSAALGPGTYAINCDFNRASGTGTVTIAQGSLKAVALQGANSNGITQLTGALQAGPGSGSQVLSGTLPIANGGTNQAGAAVNGAVIYSTAAAYGYTAAGSSGQILRSAGAASPTWTTETFPASTTINQILYSSAANVISGLATANTGALVTSSTGVPSITSGGTANRLLRTNGTTVSFSQAALATDVSGVLPVANGGTGLTSVANQRVLYGTGSTTLATDSNFIYDSTNIILNVGGSGTAKINAINASGSHTALQAYNSSAGNAFQATNVSAYTASLISRQNNATTGASIGMEFGRGTAASPTGALNGDQIGVIVAIPDAASGSAFGYSGAITFIATEDATTTATGGELSFAVTPNTTVTPIERFRIKQTGQTNLINSHLKSTQTTVPTAAATANAGTGASCSVANATDMAGQITITTGTVGISIGSYCTITFNSTYAVAPICLLTPASSTISTSVYVTSSVSTMDIGFSVAGGISTTYLMNYHCFETQ